MSNKKEFTINNYSAMNKFAEDEVAYANQASRIHNAQAFGIYAKYISLVLLAIGILLLFIGLFYWLYAVKPSQLVYNENNYSMNPSEIKTIIESQTDEILNYVDNQNLKTEEEIIILSEEIESLDQTIKSDVRELNGKIDREYSEIQLDLSNAMNDQIMDFNRTIQNQNNELEAELKSFILANYETTKQVQNYDDEIKILDEFRTQKDQNGKNITQFKIDDYDSSNIDSTDKLTIEESLDKLKKLFSDSSKSKKDEPQNVKIYEKYSDIKDGDCDRLKNPFCSFHAEQPIQKDKGVQVQKDWADASQNYQKNTQQYVVFQERDVSVNKIPYTITNKWIYNQEDTDRPSYEECYTYINIPNSGINSLKLDLYRKYKYLEPERVINNSGFHSLSNLTSQKLASNCFFANDQNQSTINTSLDRTYYAVFDAADPLIMYNISYTVETGYSFLDRELNTPYVQYCYTYFNSYQKTGINESVTVYLEYIQDKKIETYNGPNFNLLSQNEREDLTRLCNFKNDI